MFQDNIYLEIIVGEQLSNKMLVAKMLRVISPFTGGSRWFFAVVDVIYQTCLADPDQQALNDNSFGDFVPPKKIPSNIDRKRVPEGIYLKMDRNPPPRVVREALVRARPRESGRGSMPAAYRDFMEGRLPIFVLRWFMRTCSSPSTSKNTVFWQALQLMELYREDLLFFSQDRQQKLPLPDFLPAVPAVASAEDAHPTASSESEPAVPPTRFEPEVEPAFFTADLDFEDFVRQADEYIRGFGQVPCQPVHRSRYNLLLTQPFNTEIELKTWVMSASILSASVVVQHK